MYFINFVNFVFIFTFLLQLKKIYALTWLLVKHGPRPWTQTMKNLDAKKKLNPEKPEKQLDTEKRL